VLWGEESRIELVYQIKDKNAGGVAHHAAGKCFGSSPRGNESKSYGVFMQGRLTTDDKSKQTSKGMHQGRFINLGSGRAQHHRARPRD